MNQNLACVFRWNWLVVNFKRLEFQNCCKPDPLHLTKEDLNQEKLGETLMNHPSIVEGRRDLLSGVRDKACVHCWRVEDSGIESSRQAWRGSELFPKSKYAGDAPPERSVGPESVEIILDDLCNLSCLYCDEFRSSKWRQLRGLQEVPWTDPSELFEKNFWNWLETASSRLKRITISGGEPLLSRRFDRAIDNVEKILERPGGENTVFSVITNLSYPKEILRQRVNRLALISRKHPVALAVSNESFGAASELIRRGLRWETFAENFEFLMSDRQRMVVAPILTLNSLCISTLPQYLEFLLQMSTRYPTELKVICNYVHAESFMDPKILPPSFTRYLDDSMKIAADLESRSKFFKDDWRSVVEVLSSLKATIAKPPRDPEKIRLERMALLKKIEDSKRPDNPDQELLYRQYAEDLGLTESGAS